MKKALVAFGFATIAALGAIQLSTPVSAAKPIDDCAATLCVPCPDGSVLDPKPGNCCHCRRLR